MAVEVVDVRGNFVDSVEAGDVFMIVEGGTVASAAVEVPRHVKISYRMPAGRFAPVCARMSVCGAVLRGIPWTIPSLLGDSAILATVAPERRAAFLRELLVWLPRRRYRLLYRGSRDGMNGPAFHERCDHQGPTLVLVQCEEGWVFGGHAGVSWEGPYANKNVACDDAFLFSVTGPYTVAPVRFSVKAGTVDRAMQCCVYDGPTFNFGMYLRGDSTDYPSKSRFLSGCICAIGEGYEDSIGHGFKSLTGDRKFTPAEVEVYVCAHE